MGRATRTWPTGRLVFLLGTLIFAFYVSVVVVGVVFRHGDAPVADYVAFHAAGQLAAEGSAAVAYDWARLHAEQARILGRPPPGDLGWLNPPAFFFAVMPFSALPYRAAWLVWASVGALLFALAA